MATEKQIAANRLNAQRGTGPISAEGKKRSSQNALRHGLTAQKVLIAGENAEDYETFRQNAHLQFKPSDEFASRLVDRIASLIWRLERVPMYESNLLLPINGEEVDAEAQKDAAFVAMGAFIETGSSDKLIRYEGHLNRNLLSTLRELRALQKSSADNPEAT